MPSLMVVIFVVELIVQLVNTVGATTINNMLWRILTSLPTSFSRAADEHRVRQAEYLKVRKELNSTSSQDEFAKWAKLRRQHDKLLEELEKKKTGMDASRSKFDSYLSTVRLISTRGLQWFLPFWYAREPMFWLPYGWFPYYVEWFASFPRAPMGSVSIAVWQWACSGMLVLLSETITAIIGLVVASSGQKQAVPVGGRKAQATAGAAESKKRA